jgi:DNA-binding NarL/FixJ family response regulator
LRAYESATRLGAVPLRAAIEELARGARLDLTPRAAEPAGAGRKSEWGLTPREREVLELLTEGLTNPQIASRLFIANRTVGVHVSRILTKLEVGSRFEAAMKAQRHGISARTGDPVT